jgi:hypothetical protein
VRTILDKIRKQCKLTSSLNQFEPVDTDILMALPTESEDTELQNKKISKRSLLNTHPGRGDMKLFSLQLMNGPNFLLSNGPNGGESAINRVLDGSTYQG